MEQKRFTIFVVLSLAIVVGWFNLVMPLLAPKRPQPAAQKREEDEGARVAKGGADQAADPDAADDEESSSDDAEEVVQAAPAEKEPEAPVEEEELAAEAPPRAPPKKVVLGSNDPASGYRQMLTLTARGAAIESIELNDRRYQTLDKPHRPLTVVGDDPLLPHTLTMTIPQLDEQGKFPAQDWELLGQQPAEAPFSEATFRLRQGGVEITRKYALSKLEGQERETPAYEVLLTQTIKNLKKKPRVLNYILQGPAGLPLENVENTQKFRDVVVGFVSAPGTVAHEMMGAKTIADGKGEEWLKGFDYIGVDVQYFAALLMPVDDQRQTPYFKSIKQKLLGENEKEKSEITVLLTSVDLDLEGANDPQGRDAVTHSYKLFAGPKRDDVLPVGTEKVIDFGWFGWISRKMLSLLMLFQSLFGSWGIAIICLTVVVRSALFPLSIKTARGSAKMQELQPEIAALKEKYGKDKERFAREQMELFRKHQYNPFAGCLPVFLQLPIFMGLYQALNHAVDLRMAKFLWIENLAAPDALAQLPFALPLLGWTQFNLLPLITIVLFIVQQKLVMPPPANEEQAMQQKMMNFMMVFMGIMFYKVPAGLCVYFIASSLWGLAERKLLPKGSKKTSGDATLDTGSSDRDSSGDGRRGAGPKGRGPGNRDDDPPSGGGLFASILKAAEKQQSARKATPGKRK
ncbi:MAG: membrane protein insertase YidC [Planctomycetales bacterium]